MNSQIAVSRAAMRLQMRPGLDFLLGVVACISAFHLAMTIDIPLEVLGHVNIEQLPTITEQSSSSLIAFPFDESFSMTCEAKGNPEPEFRWTKNGLEFDPYLDPRLMKEENSGTFVIPNSGNLTDYQGIYRCYASNKLGTAISQEIEFIVPYVPKFPKEKIDPIVVEEGQPFVLECNPPSGIPPLQIYWMTIDLQHIAQDERVSMGLNGDLFFSNALSKDSRKDYCCYAAFPKIRTIVQKTAMSVIVKSTKSNSDTGDSPGPANAILERKPSLLTPSSVKTRVQLVKGEELLLECIAEGFPTPKIEWIKIGHKLPDKAMVENHGKLLSIPTVDDEDSGKYRCQAKNTFGEVDHYFHVTVEEPPRWVLQPESQLSMIGSDVLIKCSVSGFPQPTITWRVNGLPLEEVPASNRKVFDDTIFIKNAKESDSAVYQCEASNTHGTILANANIMIMNMPPMILTEDGLKYSTVEGKGVIMHCKVFSSPPSTVTWDKDDSAVSVEGPRFTVHENGSLEIYNVEKEDQGQYTCYTKNTEGSSAIDAMLDVKDPTRIVETPEDLQILIGTTAQLSCLAEYDKSFRDDFEILWEKDDTELASNHTEDSGYFIEDGILQIISVSHKDQGMYTCVARTPLDQDSASALLIVLDVPDAPEDLVLSEHKEKSVKLKWIPGEDHNSSTTEFIIEYEENQWEPGNWKELQRVPGNHGSAILKLHGHVDYRFRVSGVNAVGRGRPSEPTERYKTPPAAPDRNPENIKIEGHMPNEMVINWEPLLPIEHNGPGLEYKVSYRQQDMEEDWQEHMVKRHSYVVMNTPTFVPFEIKIQAKNHQGWGPEPKVRYLSLKPDELPYALEQCVSGIGNWMSANFLLLNSDKTEVQIFGPKKYRNNLSDFTLDLNGFKVSQSQLVKNLGVTMDPDLSFEHHIKQITRTAFFHLRNIAKIRNFLSKDDAEKLIHAFVTSRLDYCNVLFSGLPNTCVLNLQRVQNAAARLLSRTRKYDHITATLVSLHWLPIQARADFKVLLLTYKSLHGLAPLYLSGLLVPYHPVRTLRSKDAGYLVIPKINRKTAGGRAFSYRAPLLWNKLPVSVKEADTVSTFKVRLKTFLFSQYYDC